jgi:hypothetical protein
VEFSNSFYIWLTQLDKLLAVGQLQKTFFLSVADIMYL